MWWGRRSHGAVIVGRQPPPGDSGTPKVPGNRTWEGVTVPDAAELIDAEVDAYRRRDLEAYLGFFAPHVQVTDFDGTVLMDGVEAMRASYGQLFADSPDLAVEIPQRMVVGDFVIDEELVTGFHLPGYPTELHAVVAYRVTDGLISHMMLLT
jgi:hypothetical protein